VDTPCGHRADMLGDLEHFLSEEVLDGLPERLQRFLLETSILDELSTHVCDAVTERTDSGQILAELDRRNLFLTRHRGSAGDTWRTHDLFTAFLREQLAASYPPEDVRQLHLRAAAVLPPFRHFPPAGCGRPRGRRRADRAPRLLRPRHQHRAAAGAAIEALPTEVRDADHRLALLHVWPKHVAGQAHEVIRELAPLRDRLLSTNRAVAAAEVDAMLAEAYLQIGDLDRAGAAIEQALGHTSDSWRVRPRWPSPPGGATTATTGPG
jgi:LuxR family transcriptional regulator, maltose regulon positive regulatory protein